MNTAIIILLACGYLLLLVAAFFTGYYFGKKSKEEPQAGFKQLQYNGVKNDNQNPPEDPHAKKDVDELMGRKKPTQSAILKFPKPEMARARREQKAMDEAAEYARKNKPEKGPIVL